MSVSRGMQNNHPRIGPKNGPKTDQKRTKKFNPILAKGGRNDFSAAMQFLTYGKSPTHLTGILLPSQLRARKRHESYTRTGQRLARQPPSSIFLSMHTDPEVYPEPFKFIPERWLGDYDPKMNRNWVPFTRGSRNCLGIK